MSFTMGSFRSIVGVLIFLVAGCSTVPADQVLFYAETYDEARAAADSLYDEIVEPVRLEDSGQADELSTPPVAIAPVPPFPDSFNPADFVLIPAAGRPEDPDSIAVRRRALITVATYNEILVRLASGETAEDVSNQTSTLVNNLGSLLKLVGAANPLVGLSVASIEKLTAWAERLRADVELRKALLAGNEPVQALIAELKADTVRIYGIYKPYKELQVIDWGAEINRISNSMTDFAKKLQRPTGDLANSLTEVESRFSAAQRAVPGLRPRTLAPSRTGGAFDQAAADTLKVMVSSLETAVVARQATVDEINDYYAALGAYVRLLDQVAELNEALSAAAAHRTITLDPVDLLTRAMAIRQEAKSIRAALSSL